MVIRATLRQKAISKDRKSLYLDFYPAIPHPKTGKPTRREFLGLYLFNKGKDPINKQDNRSQNSKYSYFNELRAALKQAVKDGIVQTNPSQGLEAFKQGESEREFLTFEELQAAANTECETPQMKTIIIISCLKGLRWSDINKLLWSEVQRSNANGDYIRFRQKKTKGAETLPISEQAFSLLGERQVQEERVFKGLKYSAWHNLKLQQ